MMLRPLRVAAIITQIIRQATGRLSAMASRRALKLLPLILCPCLSLIWISEQALATRGSEGRAVPPVPTEAFAPSNARTEDGKLIPVEQFFSSSRCANCHQDTHTAWSESLHRNAAREPFYRESADILLRTRGIEFTRHCESCHTPVALFSGALSTAVCV